MSTLRRKAGKSSRNGGGRRNANQAGKLGSLETYSPSESICTVGTAIVPQKLSTVLRWQYVNNTLSVATTQSAYVAITLNGCYDPLFTLGGGTPTGFTELMALYNRYIVTKTRVCMRLRNGSSTSVGNDHIAFIMEVPAIQANLVGSIVSEDILEARRCTTMTIPYANTHQYREMNRLVDICQLEALPSLIADYDNLSGSRSTNPARSCVALCGITRPGGAQASNQEEGQFVVEFSVTFYQPTQFTVS